MLPFFTILHSLVDACSVTVLVVGGMSWQRVLAYNALAFALEFPLGVALDARPQLVKGAFVTSLALTLAGVGVCACGCVGDGAAGVRALPLGSAALLRRAREGVTMVMMSMVVSTSIRDFAPCTDTDGMTSGLAVARSVAPQIRLLRRRLRPLRRAFQCRMASQD